MSEGSITVLFVDDDEQWATFMASELEAEDSGFDVTVALNANEAIVTLDGDHSVDCIVTDFRMPEVDGIQLLERVFETNPHLPAILVTGDGSEDVAARAISAGVTDYLRKDPRVDQAPILGNRIRQAVERVRLQTEIRESEQRYRTAVEHTRDAIAIVQDGAIAFANGRFSELFGSQVDESLDEFLSYVYEADHDLVTDLIRTARSGHDPGLREVRFRGSSGSIRHCELLGDAVTYENEFATLVSIRDVTRRRSHERTLRRERQFNRAVQKRLVGAQTRDELESEITEVLSTYGYDLVWIGTADETGVRTRAAAGTSDYVDRLEEATPDGDHGGDPILWCAQTAAPQFVADFEALMPTERRNAALESGYRSGHALPLRHEDISYGMLAVYHADPSRIDEAERSLLAEVAETVSFAIHHVETQQTLTSSEGLVARVDVESDAYYLPRLLSDGFDRPDVEVTVNGTQATGHGTHVQYLSCPTGDSAALADALERDSSVREWSVLDGGDPTDYRVTVEADTPESHLGSAGALVRSSSVTPGRATISFELSSREYLQPAIARLNENYRAVTVRSVVTEHRGEPEARHARVDVDSLTEKQLFALESAYHQGYFDRPRGHSAVEVAASLGVTHATFLQHLRVAQRKVFRQIFTGVNASTTDRGR